MGRRRRRHGPVGQAPGTLRIDEHAPQPELELVTYGPDGIDERGVADAADVKQALGRQPVTWLNVNGLGDADTLRELGGVFGLHRLALEDVVNVHQRAKVERFPDNLFVVLRQLRMDGAVLVPSEQLSLFVGKDFVLTFQEREGDCFEPVRERLRAGKGKLRHAGPDYLAYALIDAIVDAYYPVLEGYGDRLEALEDEVVRSAGAGTDTIEVAHRIRRELISVRRAVWPLREALNTLIRDADDLVADETRIYLRDCYDHTVQLVDLLESYRETGSSLMEVQLSMAGQRMNEIMKVLTIFAAIFIPLTFIAGIYGMNFDPAASAWNMPELAWAWGYPAALLVMAATAVALLIHFRRKGWLGGGAGARFGEDGR
jgi:magnesium transporter